MDNFDGQPKGAKVGELLIGNNTFANFTWNSIILQRSDPNFMNKLNIQILYNFLNHEMEKNGFRKPNEWKAKGKIV